MIGPGVIGSRLDALREQVGPGVTIVAVTKGFGRDVVEAILDAGHVDLGENYAQELVAKARGVEGRPARWHMIGRLQRNKVRALAPSVALWHTLDRADVIDEVAHRAAGAAVLIQVNTSAEPSKAGCRPEITSVLVDRALAAGLDVRGLMTIAPAGGGAPASRCFAALREIRDRLGLGDLSMGMSDDLTEALAEGATIVRIGSRLVGPRPARG